MLNIIFIHLTISFKYSFYMLLIIIIGEKEFFPANQNLNLKTKKSYLMYVAANDDFNYRQKFIYKAAGHWPSLPKLNVL